ncbi:MAG: ATP synthase F1 subunit gamma [Alphaproteobacteria bacterium GM7ARS4]|nr:ATP synthase F1 subunit gamma [Alphaproteobacteria bacterium GM7ARS4]
MSQLKALRHRIMSVRSTRKITSAMKMVAAARLRRAQSAAVEARAHGRGVHHVMRRLTEEYRQRGLCHPLLSMATEGEGGEKEEALRHPHRIICMTSMRGLCGSFNAGIVRAVRLDMIEGIKRGEVYHVLCVGRKGYQGLLPFARRSSHAITLIRIDEKNVMTDEDKARAIEDMVRASMAEGQLGKVTLYYARFRTAITQIITCMPLMPLGGAETMGAYGGMEGERGDAEARPSNALDIARDGVHRFEPDDEALFEDMAFYRLRWVLYQALLESSASEHGARMTAMDNATRNAEDMMSRLTLEYNRKRQAMITRELIEIISGAEAL